MLIACFTLGAALNHISTYFLGVAQFGAGVVWTLFHYLIITLQAFIFMVLTDRVRGHFGREALVSIHSRH